MLISCVHAEEFHLSIDGGEFTDSEIIVMLGENGKKMFCHDMSPVFMQPLWNL